MIVFDYSTGLFTTMTSSAVVGVTDGSSAAVGILGEYLVSSVTSNTNYAASNTIGQVATLALTAGDWDVMGFVDTYANSCTGTFVQVSVNNTNASLGLEGFNSAAAVMPTGSGHVTITIPLYRTTSASTVNVWLLCYGTYTIGTPQFTGSIFARRVR